MSEATASGIEPEAEIEEEFNEEDEVLAGEAGTEAQVEG